MDLKAEFRQAVKEWQEALHQFHQAEEETLDYSVYQLQAAEEKMAMILRQARAARSLESLRPPRRVSPPLVSKESGEGG